MREASKYLEDLAQRCIAVCDKFGWDRDWKEGGCYLHLEASEFIEAIRGKGETHIESEAADVLFVFLALLSEHDIQVEHVMQMLDLQLKVLEEDIPCGQTVKRLP